MNARVVCAIIFLSFIILMASTDIIFTWTGDGIRLQGVHYLPQQRDTCFLFVHGMSGNYIDNYFGHVLGEALVKENIGFIFTHNRGHSHINDLLTNRKKSDGSSVYERIGATYERFEACVDDIESWLTQARELGYKKFVILGHSLGGPKVVHHYFKQQPKDVIGVVLASAADMVGLAVKPEYQPNYRELLAEAKANVANNEPRKLLSDQIWQWYTLSSQTFLDLFEDGCPADVLPVLRNPDIFPQLASITVPILCIMGEFDDIAIRTLSEDMELLKRKATGTPSFKTVLLPKANHGYEGQEKPFADTIVSWVKEL